MDDFLLYVKSTIDKFGSDLAAALSVTKKVDLDDIVNTTELLASEDTAIVWEVTTLNDAPVDPLYDLIFSMGVKVTGDPSNYNMMKLLSSVHNLFPQGSNHLIFDYSGDVAGTDQKGDFTVVDVRVDPQQFDRVSGIRLVSIRAKAVRGG